MRVRRTVIWGIVAVALLAVGLLAAAPPQVTNDVAMFDGKPTFKEGKDYGYYIWRDDDTWHVRWTTLGARRVFRGIVRARNGELYDLKSVDVETERTVIAPGRPARVVRTPRGRTRVLPGREGVVATRIEDVAQLVSRQEINFRAITDDDIDGFDFKVRAAADQLRFELMIGADARSVDIEVGKDNKHPTGDPFVVKLR